MRKVIPLVGVAVLTAILALGAIACNDDDKDKNGDGTTPVATSESTPAVEETSTPAADTTPAAGAEVGPITMNAVDDSGVSGSATITEDAAGGAEVVVTITAGLEEGSHQSHIHHGDCSDPTGEIHSTLTNVEADATGAGTANTTLDPPDNPDYAHWLSRAHYVAVHALDGTVVACGDVLAAS